MFVQETGKKGAPSIVFLHGGGTANWMWQEQVKALGADYHCLVPDLPGHGESNELPWVSFADTADQIAEIIRQRATNGRAHMVGLSLGGYLVVNMLSQAPELVDHAMVSGINVLPFKGAFFVRLLSLVLTPFMKMTSYAKNNAKALKIPEEYMQQYIDGVRKLNAKAYRRISSQALDFRLPEISPDLAVPTLIVVGQNEVKNALDSQPVLLHGIPEAVGVIAPEVGHGWSGEKPALFSKMVRCWIEDDPLPAELLPV